jgi:hypothetical protein
LARYTVLTLDSKGDVTGSRSCYANSDEAASIAARLWLGSHPAVEVWKGPTAIATISGAFRTGSGVSSSEAE